MPPYRSVTTIPSMQDHDLSTPKGGNDLRTYDILSEEEVRQIHEQSLAILAEVGVEFTYEPALALMREHGQRVEAQRVYLDRDFVEAQLKKTPSDFTLQARNAEKSVTCGKNEIIYTMGYGLPYIYELDGSRRYSLMEDYDNIVKLADASDVIHTSGGNVCEPTDVNSDYRHLDMLYSHVKHSDKNFMGSAYGKEGAQDSLAIAEMLYGGSEAIRRRPALITLINSITPLKYDDRMLAALMTYAEAGQANLISALVMSGSTGPVTMAGTIALQNAEVLAGIVLAQCVRPGAPVVYGSSSGASDMRTVSLSIGNAETALYTSASAQMGRFYNLPSRGGGGLTDAKTVDAQAGYESMLLLAAASFTGINYVLHAAGIMQYYTAFSYEKFIVDVEICELMLKYRRGFDFGADMFAFDDIKEIGPGGHFLYQQSTLMKHRSELRSPSLSDRQGYEGWELQGMRTIAQVAHEKWQQALAQHESPPLDEALDRELCHYIQKRKGCV